MPRKKRDALDAAPDRADRIKKILEVLTQKPTRTEDFSKILGVTSRQVRRDLNDLLAAGKIRRVGHKYQLMGMVTEEPSKKYGRATPKPPIVTANEIKEYDTAIEALAPLNLAGVSKHLIMMREMFVQDNPNLKKELGETKKDRQAMLEGYGRSVSILVSQITHAISTQECLELEYEDNKKKVSKRTIAPFRLFHAENHQLYLCAWSSTGNKSEDKENLRFYLVARIHSLAPSSRPFVKNITKRDVDEFIRHTYGAFPCRHISRVIIDVNPDLENYIRTNNRLHSEQFVVNDGKTMLVRFDAGINAPLVSKLVALGSNAYVVAPTELRDAVVKHLEETLKHYAAKKAHKKK